MRNLDTAWFGAIPSNGDAEMIYNARNRFDRDMALDAWSPH